MTERFTHFPDSGDGLDFIPELDGVTIGLLTARAIHPAQRELIRQYENQHPLQGTVARSASSLLAIYLPDDQQYVEETVDESRNDIWEIIWSQALRSGTNWDTDQQTKAVESAIAGAKRLVALGAFLRQNGISHIEINCGSKIQPDVQGVNLQDIDVAIQIATNTVVAVFGQQINLVRPLVD